MGFGFCLRRNNTVCTVFWGCVGFFLSFVFIYLVGFFFITLHVWCWAIKINKMNCRIAKRCLASKVVSAGCSQSRDAPVSPHQLVTASDRIGYLTYCESKQAMLHWFQRNAAPRPVFSGGKCKVILAETQNERIFREIIVHRS